MNTIHKAVLQIHDSQYVEMPLGAEILTVQMQGPTCCLWYKCDPAKYTTRRHIGIFGTGHDLPNVHMNYLGTIQWNLGQLVFHIFELP